MSVVHALHIPQKVKSQPPRKLTGRDLARLCRGNNSIAAALLAVELAMGKITLVKPTPEQAVAITGATIGGYCTVQKLILADATR